MPLKVHEPLNAQIAQRIRARRLALGLTPADVAEALGVSFQQLQKYESGVNRISAGQLYTLANLLDVSIDFFFQNGDVDQLLCSGIDQDLARSNQSAHLIQAYYAIPPAKVSGSVLRFLCSLNDTKKQ
ncbi:helix-turn-helix domain-containing protein [Pelagibius sp. Alg239-R121]|uniref:helix-turn-helix domain-containing protein n=1 Tax=Pelagibius sp. Alg239-R121 TaxID=2993448 RepID=UPI0024A74792|nr:helix-turn-helix transcriptional regulator [Pelagibius sp. Alg239-R121]